MAATQYMNCASATEDRSLFSSGGGTRSIDTAKVRGTNAASYKLDTSSPAALSQDIKTGIMADAGRRFSQWWNFASVTPAAIALFMQVANAAGTGIINVQLQTTGKLRLNPVGATVITGNTALLANTWYRISVAYVITDSTHFQIKVYLNGALEMSSTTGTLTNVGTDRVTWSLPTVAGANFIANYDEIYVDDGTDLADPGNIGVTAKLPTNVNTGGFDTTVGNGAVAERPISVTNGMQDAAVHDVQQNYTLQTANVGDVDISGNALVARTAWIWAKQATGAAGTPKIMDNGSESAITLTTAAALYTVITDSASYPSNAAGIGMRSANHANDTFLYECGTMIAYYEKPVPKGLFVNQAVMRAANW